MNLASKLFLTTALFVIQAAGVTAQAMAFPSSNFVAQQCGAQMNDIGHTDTHVMERACVGYFAGTKIRAVQFTLSNDATYLFRVEAQSNLMMAIASGATMSLFRLTDEHGESLTMKAIVNHDGTLKSASGQFQTNAYVIPDFEQMVSLL